MILPQHVCDVSGKLTRKKKDTKFLKRNKVFFLNNAKFCATMLTLNVSGTTM
jgi:hypothetical protein